MKMLLVCIAGPYLCNAKKMRSSIASRCCPVRIYVLQRTYRLHLQCNFEGSSRICKWLLAKVYEMFSFEFLPNINVLCANFLYIRVERSLHQWFKVLD